MKRFATSMTTKLTMRAAIALVVASAGATWCLATPVADIGDSSFGPLTHVWVGNDLSCQAQHMFDAPNYEFYPAGDGFNLKPGDYGTFIAMDGMLYAPDFGSHDLTAAFSIGFFTPFTPVSQSGVGGSGTTAAPYKVVTMVDVADTGLHIQQTDTYVAGDEFFTTEIMISNDGTDTASGVLYRAFDAFLGGSDFGYGFTKDLGDNRTAVACSVNQNNSPAGKIEELIPITGGNDYVQDYYDTVWSYVGFQAPLPDYCACSTHQDNGAGISWNFSIPAGGSATYSHQTLISAPGLQGLVTSKTADSPTSPAGAQNGYTITIQNPNATAVTVSSITDTLPPGFHYLGSTTGATASNPAINGQMLTWSGPFTVPGGGGTITLHFAVTVSTTPGTYFNEAGGSAQDNYNVIGTGPTAPITVTSTATKLAVSEAKGTYGGLTTFTAALSSGDNPIAGATINFTLNGNDAGSGTTDAQGVATSSAVLLVGSSYNAGTYGPAAGTGAEARFAGNASYGATSGYAKLTIYKAPLSVSADNKTRLYGEPNPQLTYGFTGFVNNEVFGAASSGVTGTLILTTTAIQSSPVGKYPITFDLVNSSLADGNNYEIKYVPGTLTVYLGGLTCLDACTIGASSAVVDSYDSSIGYPTSQSYHALVLSNGTITLQGAKVYGDMDTAGKVTLQANSLVTGDVAYGTTLSLAGSAAIQGAINHQSTPFIVAPIPDACGSYTQAPTTWITGAYTYDAAKGNLTVSGGGTATLASGNYCFNNVTVSGGSTLVIGGTVMINVTGKFVDSGGSLQNTSYIPFNLQVASSYTGSNGVTVSGTSATYMTIYAPGTGVTISGGGPLYGALVGKTLTVSGNSFVHEDLALPDVWSVFGP